MYTNRSADSLLSVLQRAALCVTVISTTILSVGLGSASSAYSQDLDITGTWEGKLVVPQGSLRLVFHITQGNPGYAATLDSPDQGAIGIPVSSVSVDDSTVVFNVASVQGKYEGTVQPDGSIEGNWSQGPGLVPVNLVRMGAAESKDDSESSDSSDTEVGMSEGAMSEVELDHPYQVEQLVFHNAADNIDLAGTLTVPEGSGPFPAVVLLSGSGPQDRDGSVFGHKPFRVIANHLTRQGFVVLRFDDRGVGESEGNYAEGTIELFSNDAEAAVAYLETRADVRLDKIGLIGHSEGGIVAPIVQQRGANVSFMVLLAGPAIPGREILFQQSRLILAANGAEANLIETNSSIQQELFDLLATDLRGEEFHESVRTIFAEETESLTAEERSRFGYTAANIDAQIKLLELPWFRHFVSYDPGPTLSQVDCPVLALFGGKDLQVPSTSNIAAIDKLIEANPSVGIKVVELEDMNHLFQAANTGSPSEYKTIEEPISPIALNEISSWLTKL